MLTGDVDILGMGGVELETRPGDRKRHVDH